jgi:hypothetical protein
LSKQNVNEIDYFQNKSTQPKQVFGEKKSNQQRKLKQFFPFKFLHV